MGFSSKHILVVYKDWDKNQPMRSAVWNHLRVMECSDKQHRVTYYDVSNPVPPQVKDQQWDAIIMHTSLLCYRWAGRSFYEFKPTLNWVRNIDCLKIAMPQDEYDHSDILDEWLFEMGIQVIFSNFGAAHRSLLYRIMHDKATFYHCFTGYIHEPIAEELAVKLLPIKSRPKDIVYRATNLPYRFGKQGQIKSKIAKAVGEAALSRGLVCDISIHQEDTILGRNWFQFLASGRAVLGCESGSSVLDRRGDIRAQIDRLLACNPALSFGEVSVSMPPGWDSFGFLAIGPRHFEAVMTKTCQILVEGYYNGVLDADRHYIALKQDFSNLDEVLRKLTDHELMQEIVDQAYQDIYMSGRYSYQTLATAIEDAIADYRHGPQKKEDGDESATERQVLLKALEVVERQLVSERLVKEQIRVSMGCEPEELESDLAMWAKIKRSPRAALFRRLVQLSSRRLLLLVVLTLLGFVGTFSALGALAAWALLSVWRG